MKFARPRPRLSRVVIPAVLLLAVPFLTAPPASAKTPGKRYCFHGLCRRVSTLAQTETFIGWRGYLLASYYDDCSRDRFNPCGLTSSGAVFHPDRPDNAASPLFPDGTVILAYNPKSGDASVLRITNAGPYSGDRKLDVSRAGAESLGFKAEGVAHLVVSVLQAPTVKEATYVRERVYPKVPGHIGVFENFTSALAAASAKLGIDPPEADDADASDEAEAEAPDQSDLKDRLIVKPRPAVSPYFARELVMLRLPPRPVTRMQPGDQDTATPSAEGVGAGLAIDFGFGLRKFIAGGRVVASGGEVTGSQSPGPNVVP